MDENNRTTDQEDAETGESRGRFSRAKEYVGGKYNTMRERAEDVDFGAITDQVRDYVRSNPGKALLISVGIGFLVGLMLRRRKSDSLTARAISRTSFRVVRCNAWRLRAPSSTVQDFCSRTSRPEIWIRRAG